MATDLTDVEFEDIAQHTCKLCEGRYFVLLVQSNDNQDSITGMRMIANLPDPNLAQALLHQFLGAALDMVTKDDEPPIRH